MDEILQRARMTPESEPDVEQVRHLLAGDEEQRRYRAKAEMLEAFVQREMSRAREDFYRREFERLFDFNAWRT